MKNSRLVPPAIPTKLLLSILGAALLCLAIPRIVNAGTSQQARVAPQTAIAHLDVEVQGKAPTNTRLSLRITEGGLSELITEVDGVRYNAKVRAHREGTELVAEVEIDAHSKGGLNFEMQTRSISKRGTVVLLGHAGKTPTAGIRVSLTLE